MKAHPTIGAHLSAPSVSYGSINLYARGVFEAETRPNLAKVRGSWVFVAGVGIAMCWWLCAVFVIWETLIQLDSHAHA
jgi:hypothetical protein